MLEHKASNFAFAVGLRTMMNFMAYNFTKCKVKRYCNHPNEKENYNFNNIKTKNWFVLLSHCTMIDGNVFLYMKTRLL